MRAPIPPAISLFSISILSLLAFSLACQADPFTTIVVQAAGQNWNGAIWDPGLVAPTAGNSYEALDNGVAFGNGQANTRIRNPATAGLQTFVGDSLTLNTNTEIRAKAGGAILNFPGVGGNPGLILNGGVLNAGDDAVFVLTGKVQVASTSFIVPGDNGAGAVLPARGFNISAQLSGNGTLVIYQAGTNVAQEISGTSNSFTGDWVVKSGWLKGSGINSLGTGQITIDPLAAIEVDPSVTPAEGPALFEPGYEMVSPGTLSLLNGGMMILHQNCTLGAVTLEGTPLSKGAHPYSELLAAFPNNFAPGGSGSITVGIPAPRFTMKVAQAAGENWSGAIWDPGKVSPVAGATYELISNGTPFGSALGNTRLRNPATAGLQTFPGDSLTVNPNTEIRAKQPGAILNFPGAGGLPGLILNGGALNAGDDAVFVITGKVQIVSKSYIVPADNGGGAVKPLRGFNLAGELSGSGTLVIYQAGTNVAQEISGTQNPFSGDILLKAGWLKGSGSNSLGTGNIIIDPKAAVNADPSVTPIEGPALFEVNYDIVTPGNLTLQNGGQMLLHQNATFERVTIDGTPLETGIHSFAELATAFPANFQPGGSGSITARSGPGHFTTIVTQAGGTDWNAGIWDPGPVSPSAGNTYETLDNGTAFGAAQNNTRIRNPAVAGVQTFPGDSLTLNTNSEIRAKGPGAILNFPGIGSRPGLILKGGVLNAGDDAVFVITGKIQVASTSFIVPADNGAGAITPLRGINLAGQLSGNGGLVIYQAGTQVAQEISGNQNTFSGDIILKAGWLKGSGNGSLGSGNVLIDPLVPVEVDPSSTPAEGPAQLEIMYDIFSPGKLTLLNGGLMILHQDCTFSAVEIEGTSLTAGTHPYSELLASFPNNFAPDGSGSITVRAPSAPPAPANLTVINGNGQVTLTWSPAPSATGYIVSRSTNSGGPYSNAVPVFGTNFVSSGLVNGTTSYYVVIATNGFGASTNSIEAVGRPNTPVTGLLAAPGSGGILLTWSNLTGAVSYVVKRSATSGGPYTNIATGITGTNYMDSSVQTGHQYYYAVLASLGNGLESGLSSEAPGLTPPSPPTLTASLFAASVIALKVSTADPAPADFQIEQSADGVNFTPLAKLTNGITGFIHTNLTLGTTYSYRALAQNASGLSAYSTLVSASTPKFGLNINFANAVNGTPANDPAPAPPGYLQDVGEVFGDRGNGHSYGWDRDITTDGRWRKNAASPDLRYDTFMHFQKAVPSAIWEIEIPNGAYQVHLVSGDPTATDSVFEHDVEGTVTETYTPVAGAFWHEWTVNVQVADDRLTITTGSDGANNKIDFIDIYSAPSATTPAFSSLALSGSNLTISWTGDGKLEEAPDVTGPWAASPGNPQGSVTVQTTAPRKFYRLVP